MAKSIGSSGRIRVGRLIDLFIKLTTNKPPFKKQIETQSRIVIGSVLIGLFATPAFVSAQLSQLTEVDDGSGALTQGDVGKSVSTESETDSEGGEADEQPTGDPEMLGIEDRVMDPSIYEPNAESLPERYLTRSTTWRPPDYSGQDGALGYAAGYFKVPVRLRDRVNFWIDIYARYTTDQGVLHDTQDLSIVYRPIDFGSIMRDPDLPLHVKSRRRTKMVEDARAETISQLQDLASKLAPQSRASDLAKIRDREELRLLKLFSRQGPAQLEKNLLERKRVYQAIKEAANKKRVRFQLGQKDKFILGVFYSGRYLKGFEKHFREERLPIELTRLPFVESSFNIQARSKVGASGVWQFMPRTAKPMMMVNAEVDERNDPMTAARGAARLLRENYMRLQSWPLAITAYNHGASGLERAVRKTKSRDLADIIDRYSSRSFGFASANFYACFLAAVIVERQARERLGEVKWSLEFEGAEIDVSRPIPWSFVVEVFDQEQELAVLQNPHIGQRIREGRVEIPVGTFVRIPATRFEVVRDYLEGRLDPKDLSRQLSLFPIPKPESIGGSQPATHPGYSLVPSRVSEILGSVGQAAKKLLPMFGPATPTPRPLSGEDKGPDGRGGMRLDPVSPLPNESNTP